MKRIKSFSAVGAVMVLTCSVLTHADEPQPLKPVAVTASAAESKAAGGHGDYSPDKTIDGDLKPASSWRAEIKDEKSGEWIRYDLGSVQAVAKIRLMFVKGNERIYRFVIETSDDDKTWVTVFTGASDGKTADFETFTPDKASAGRYVRIRGFGNNSANFANWFNLVEVQIVPAAK